MSLISHEGMPGKLVGKIAMIVWLFGLGSAQCAAAAPDKMLALAQDTSAVAAEAAQSSSSGPSAEPDTPVTASSWEFSVTPYLWASGLNGDVGVFPRLPPVNVDMSFGDVLDNLEFVGMATFQARHESFVAMADITYIDLGTSEDIGIRDPSLIAADLDVENFTSTVAMGYRAVDQDMLFFDVVAGLRITDVRAKVALAGPARMLVAENSETWIDPVVGARIHVPIGDAWSVAVYGDIGGFGFSSDLTWQVLGVVHYRLSDRWALSAGWREYAIDYKNRGFVYDVSMGGPILGASYRF